MSLRTILTPGAQDLPWTDLYAHSITAESVHSPSASVYKTDSTQTVASGSAVKLTGWTNISDPDSMFNHTSNAFVIQSDGVYRLDFMVQYVENNTGVSGTAQRNINVVQSGSVSATYTVQAQEQAFDSLYVTLTGYVIANCAIDDAFVLQMQQNSGGAIPINGGVSPYCTLFSCTKIH